MKLYWHPFAIMPWRVRIALHEKGLAYDSVHVDVYSSKERSAEFQLMNPFGQIPVLEDDGLTIAESLAILEYLDERYPQPSLSPGSVAARATMRQFMCWGTDYWPPAWSKWMAPRMPGATWTDASVKEGRDAMSTHLDVLESRLAGNDWLVGDYSLADICYAPLVLVLDRVGLQDEVATRPNVSRWLSALRRRPSIQATMMPAR